MAKIKVSDYIASRLKNIYDIKNVFMVSGGGAMHLNDSFGKYIPYICNHNEQACAIAAEGYAKASSKLAVVNVTTGPGGLNCLNGVFGQWTDSVPVLYISGQVKRATTLASCPDLNLRQLGDQEADIISVVKPLTKYAVMVKNPLEIKYHLDRAVYEATTGRKGPVWLDIPIDVQAAVIDEQELIDFDISCKPPSTKEDCKITEVLSRLSLAKTPLIVAGHGIRLSGMKHTFLDILKNLNIPVVTTFNGFDLLNEDTPQYIGRIGTIGQRAGNFALQNADLVLFLGTRNNIRQISYNWENFARNAYKIVVDIDKAELEKPLVKPDMAIHADLADFLPLLKEALTSIDKPEWLTFCRDLKERYSFSNTKEYSQTGDKINVYYFVRRLTELMSENDVCVTANGTAIIASVQTAMVKNNQRIFSNSGDASMGYDLPAAIGACVANNKKNTICIAGDGSLMMNLQELQTLKHHNLPVKIFILNNDGYSSIKQTQTNFFEGRNTGAGTNSGVSMPDFVKVGSAFDIKSIRLESPNEIDNTIKDVLSTKGPVLCDVIVNPDYIFTPKLSSRKLEDGTMISPSLEDMYPFLPRDEYEKNFYK
jgi:thiamine pyrophosphate protein TPP binding domain protein